MKETDEDKMIQDAFEALLTSYKNSNHRQKTEIIQKAFTFANNAHKGARRRSGEPYIMHPIAVAMIVSQEMGLGSTSICSALLHDVVEDTDYTVEDISNMFGEKIAQIVDGLTKISGGIFAEAASTQAENMRRLLLTMSDDIRVILIKIADRLHNMRTLGSMLPAKQYKIAGETMYLYAPLAHRLGFFSIKTELEDLSFKYEHLDEYKQIETKLAATQQNRDYIYQRFAAPVENILHSLGYEFKMQARVKSIYSIWNKMQAKKVGFDDIYDIFAVRIIFEPKPDVVVKQQCWEIYSAITDIYKVRPDRLRDWVSRPKANGYQALHLTVMGPDGQWIEVQIRTTQMDDVAEKGFAAHWKYKESKGNASEIQEQTELDNWMETIQDILEDKNSDAMEFLDTIKLNLYGDEIFIFTPKGEMRTLPQSATALDFAYAIHSNLGDRCIGAKINHKLVPLSYKLESGDQVEILTSKAQTPQEEWLSFVTTAKAKTKIVSYLKKQRKIKTKEGETLVAELYKDMEPEQRNKIVDMLLPHFGYNKRDDFFYAYAEGLIKLPENPMKFLKDKQENVFMRYVKQAFNVGNQSSNNSSDKETSEDKIDNKIDKKKVFLLKEEDFQKNFVTYNCCRPIPGDAVFGFIRADGRLDVHKISCQPALKLKTHHGDKIVACTWDDCHTFSFPCTLEIKGIDRIGILNDITQVITNDLLVNTRKMSMESKDGFFEGKIEVFVHDVGDVQKLLSKIQKVKGVKSVIRID